MSFVEPFLVWGTLAVIIPVAIHFWHQKLGKPLPWAATQWLTETQQQQSRGLRLDNILLLVIRCLLLVLLAILLAQPLLNWFAQPPPIQKVHLVQPSASVATNFRFELTEALKKGERTIWADNQLEPLTDPITPPQKRGPLNPLALQTAINQLDVNSTELHLYVSNSQALADVPSITVPKRFQLHVTVDSTSKPRRYLASRNGRKLFINRAGKLISSSILDPTLKFQSAPAHAGPIRVALRYQNGHERQTVKAALTALTDVYGLDLMVDEKPAQNSQYALIMSDKATAVPSPQTLYIVSGQMQRSTADNVLFISETLTPQTSERVENGQLPEWLGEQILQHYGLNLADEPLSQQDLKALFVPSAKPATKQHAGLQNGLLFLFISLVLLERWLALTKNA